MDKKMRAAIKKGKKMAVGPHVAAVVAARGIPGATVKAALEGKPKATKAAKPVKEGAMPKLPPMPKARGSRKPKPTHPCACGGCGAMTTGTWAPGHDARAKGWALRVERGICKLSDVPKEELAGAKLMLKARTGIEVKPIKLVAKKVKAKAADPVVDNPDPPTSHPEDLPAEPATVTH